MTVVTSSQTSEAKYFLQVRSDGQAESCSCGDYTYRQAARGGQCKHIRVFNAQFAKTIAFQQLMTRFDMRSQVVREANRAAYIEDFQIYG